MLRIFRALFSIIIFACTSIYGADFPQCNNEPMESFVAVASNCSKAIYCNGVASIMLDCDKDSPYFSTADQKCHNSTTVCGNRPFRLLYISTTTPLSIPTVATSTAIVSSTLTVNRNQTNTTTSVANSTVTSRPHQAATTVEEPLTPAAFTISSTKITASTGLVPVFVQCPAIDDSNKPLFLPHYKSCSQYYLCYHGVATRMKCPNKLHFDVSQQTCNTPEEARCQVNYLIPREKCQLQTVSFYPHPTNCNYYYRCEYGFLMVMQCPFNMYWDYKRRVCGMRSKAECYTRNANQKY